MEQPIAGLLNPPWRGRFLRLFLSLAAAVVVVAWAAYRLQSVHEVRTYAQRELGRISAVANAVMDTMAGAVADLMFLEALIDDPAQVGADGIPPASHLNRVLTRFLAHRTQYDQVRLLDLDGKERARVQRDGDTVTAVPTEDLQDKSDRYYFKRTVKLTGSEVYLSAFDANVEYGRIEFPYRPTVRLAKPVHFGGGAPVAILILNYRGALILDCLRQINVGSGGRAWLVTAQGRWRQDADGRIDFVRAPARGAKPAPGRSDTGDGGADPVFGPSFLSRALDFEGASPAMDTSVLDDRLIAYQRVDSAILEPQIDRLLARKIDHLVMEAPWVLSTVLTDFRRNLGLTVLSWIVVAVVVLVLAVIAVMTAFWARGEHRQQAAHAALADERNLMLTFFDESPNAIFLKKADGEYAYCNRTYARLHELPRRQIVGKTADQFMTGPAANRVAATDERVRRESMPLLFAEEFTTAEGKRELNLTKFPIIDFQGRLTHIGGISNDVTRLNQAVREAREGEARFRALLAGAPDAMVIVAPDGTIRMVNQIAERLFDYPRRELLGRSVEDLVPDAVRTKHVQHRTEFGRRPMNRMMRAASTLVAVRRDGSSFPAEINLSPVTIDGEPHVICGVRDISERINMDRLIRQSQKMDAIGQLTGGVAHDFNNLLAGILGNLELSERFAGDSPALLKRLAIAKGETLRGAELTKRLLAFARQHPLETKATDVNAVIRGMADLLERTLGAHITITETLADPLPAVAIDPHAFESALLNLAINARDAMPDGGRLVIETRRQSVAGGELDTGGERFLAGDYVVVSVTDTGTGIADELIDRMFEPFFTTKREGRGTGLGLAMVYGFVRQSEGFIRVYSKIGLGSSFDLFLPIDLTDTAPAPSTAQGRPQPAPADARVLLMGDNAFLADVNRRHLEAAGFRVDVARSEKDVLDALSDRPETAVVFVDITMPDTSHGIALAEALHARAPDAAILFAAGYPSNLLRVRAADERLPSYVSVIYKPYSMDELAGVVREAVSLAADHREG
ncbi:MAG: PAS domain S-box protein [Hyphomicrobiales bacterium]|nr:PAS domain S-box protein [Hyphomicrobiales bacterium]